MNEIIKKGDKESGQQTMTVKEVAEALGVSERTVRRTVNELGSVLSAVQKGVEYIKNLVEKCYPELIRKGA